jgi:hypothetical protein
MTTSKPSLTYEIKGDKIILCKDGAYFGFNIEQWLDLSNLVEEVSLKMKLPILEYLLDEIYGDENPDGYEVETD